MKNTLKNLFQFFFILMIFISCNNQNQTKMTTQTSNNEKLVKQYFEYFNAHNWQKMSEMYAETTQFKDPTLGQGIVPQTRKQTFDKYSELNKVFPDLKDEVIATYSSGEKHIIVEFVSSGTAPDGSKFTLPICAILTIENGLITKDFSYFDNFEEGK